MLPFQQEDVIRLSKHIVNSYKQWTGDPLVHGGHAPHSLAQHLYHAPFIVAAHGIERDPIFCYANVAAQRLWRMPWEQFMTLPSRMSAEPDEQKERERFLKLAEEQGYVDNYHGIRVTSEGRRFKIKRCLLWTVLDGQHRKIGQAARFAEWEWI